MGTTVDNALGIVSVAILGRATLDVRLSDVIGVDVDGTTGAGIVAAGATTTAESSNVVLLLVGTDSVGASSNTLGEVDPRNVGLNVEGLGLLGRELKQLLHVEELDTMADTLRANDESILEDLHLAPDDRVVLCGKTSEILELTLLGDLGECSTVGLANGNELTALVRPSPRT